MSFKIIFILLYKVNLGAGIVKKSNIQRLKYWFR